MIELRVEPVVGSVALLAGNGVSEGDVVRGLRLFEIRFMTRKASRGHSLKSAVGRVLVAGIAIDCSMAPGQWKTVIVLLDLLNRYSPAAYAVALFAIRAQLAPVKVCVAILATLTNVAEYRFHVALRTRHILVKSAQRIVGLIVIEFRNGANRFPPLCRVTVLARNVQIAVGATRAVGALVRPARKQAEN